MEFVIGYKIVALAKESPSDIFLDEGKAQGIASQILGGATVRPVLLIEVEGKHFKIGEEISIHV